MTIQVALRKALDRPPLDENGYIYGYIRRSCWRPGLLLEVQESSTVLFLFSNVEDCVWQPCIADLLAEDWEEVKVK